MLDGTLPHYGAVSAHRFRKARYQRSRCGSASSWRCPMVREISSDSNPSVGVISITITLFNKAVFSWYHFNYPNALTAAQMVFALLFLEVLKARSAPVSELQ